MVDTPRLLRETAYISYGAAETGAKNVVFDIDIPENHALELWFVDFILSAGSAMVQNRYKYFIVDDPDETGDPDHAAEKVVQSTEQHVEFLTSGKSVDFLSLTMDCHRTLFVRNPNFIFAADAVPGASIYPYARIWFDLIKIPPRDIVDLLRQQLY